MNLIGGVASPPRGNFSPREEGKFFSLSPQLYTRDGWKKEPGIRDGADPGRGSQGMKMQRGWRQGNEGVGLGVGNFAPHCSIFLVCF